MGFSGLQPGCLGCGCGRGPYRARGRSQRGASSAKRRETWLWFGPLFGENPGISLGKPKETGGSPLLCAPICRWVSVWFPFKPTQERLPTRKADIWGRAEPVRGSLKKQISPIETQADSTVII